MSKIEDIDRCIKNLDDIAYIKDQFDDAIKLLKEYRAVIKKEIEQQEWVNKYGSGAIVTE